MTRPRPIRTTPVLLGLGLAGAALLGGCTSQGGESYPAQPTRTAERSDVAVIGECLERRGYDVTVDERTRSVDVSGAERDRQAYDATYRLCRRQAGL